jgi:hypothetical protein
MNSGISSGAFSKTKFIAQSRATFAHHPCINNRETRLDACENALEAGWHVNCLIGKRVNEQEFK